MSETTDLPEREAMDFDVVIVGAGPAGLAAAIRLKQQAPDLEVAVLEKGADVGAHILSGAVIDPAGLDALVPDWRETASFARTPVRKDRFVWMGPAGAIALPGFLLPPAMKNHGCFIVSLGEVCRWLGEQAAALGVEVFAGFAAAEVLTDTAGAVIGVATGDLGIGKDGTPKPTFERGVALYARYTLIAEGARGSLARQLISRYGLAAEREPQKYGLGLKEVWRVKPEKHVPGLVRHSFGWPLDNRTGGGSFMYHADDGTVSVGLVVHLNYANPFLSPFGEFQRFKTHPAVAAVLQGGERLSFGGRAITEGGYQSVPKLVFPGGALVGCAAGFVNVPRIKGTHNAMLSGMLAADRVAAAIGAGRAHDEIDGYDEAWRSSEIGRDLWSARNVKPLWSRFGTFLGVGLAGLDMWTNRLGFSFFGTLGHGKADHEATLPADQARPIVYPKPDRTLTFDRASSIYLAQTGHEEDQPPHLKVVDPALQKTSEHDVYGGPSTRYCPAGVYEWDESGSDPAFVINAANCIHCKTCDIKDPNQNIDWTVPEGGGGPRYQRM